MSALLTTILLAPAALAAERTLPQSAERDITVMTRNVYHGVDAEINAVPSATSFLDLIGKVTDVYQGYHARNFPERAAAIAKEVEQARPALIGLQEAVLVRTDTPADGPATPATTVELDFVHILLRALAARGLEYEVIIELPGLDVELPSSLGIDVRHTEREVIMARSDLASDELQLSNQTAGTFATNCVLPSATLGPISITRGWVSVDARVRGGQFRFISTHLDGDCLPFTSSIQQAQAQELLSGPADTDLPIVLVGDLNTPADGTGVTYDSMLAAGFEDAWAEVGMEFGLTCCQDDDLLNPVSALTSRIDFVLFREGAPPRGSVAPMTATGAEVVGENPLDRTPSGLWPSDHAGVIATLDIGHP